MHFKVCMELGDDDAAKATFRRAAHNTEPIAQAAAQQGLERMRYGLQPSRPA